MGLCHYFDTNVCRSCTSIDVAYSQQLKHKEDHLHTLLEPYSPSVYLETFSSPLIGFRNKAKMVALPTAQGVSLGFSDGVSLTQCPLYDTSMQRVLGIIEQWLREMGIQAYDVAKKKGELKYVLLSQSRSENTMMLRFVLRSHGVVSRLRRALSQLLQRASELKVVTVNIQPIHMAILEGEEEIFLTEEHHIIEHFNGIPLTIRPKSFFQTNPVVAEGLYKTAAQWVDEINPTTVWDLFCGVGGFALHCARETREIVGIEIEPEAIACAKASAEALGFKNLRFESLDAARFSISSKIVPDVVIVNPPRRGLGEELCGWLERVSPKHILYSSCNATSLAKDLETLRGYTLNRGQLFDMFPHTAHYEVLIELTRKE